MPYWDNDPHGGPLEDDTDPRVVKMSREQIRAMERDAAAARDATARAEKAERLLAMSQAGIDTSSPLGSFFADNYKGELTKDKILAEAKKLNVVTGEAPPEPPVNDNPPEGTPPVNEPVLDANVRESLASGATSETPPSGKPAKEAALETAQTLLSTGASGEEALGSMFHELVGHAIGGDKTVILGSMGQPVQ